MQAYVTLAVVAACSGLIAAGAVVQAGGGGSAALWAGIVAGATYVVGKLQNPPDPDANKGD